jgi:hypothetical protein
MDEELLKLLTPEQIDQILGTTGIGQRRAGLGDQLADEQAQIGQLQGAPNPDDGQHSTGLGAALGGLANAVHGAATAHQVAALRGGIGSLRGQQGALDAQQAQAQNIGNRLRLTPAPGRGEGLPAGVDPSMLQAIQQQLQAGQAPGRSGADVRTGLRTPITADPFGF